MPRDTAQVQFDTLTIEGGLFTAEWLGKVANFAAPAQGDSDYQVRAGFTLREEIALAWRAAQALWVQFDKSRVTPGHEAIGVTQRFVTDLLKQAFGFQPHGAPGPVSADDRVFPISHFAFDGTVPVIEGAHSQLLDTADAQFGDPDGQRRRSAFGLLQEYLNAQNTALWGIVSNGLILRVARDNASLTRPAWLEADLERVFEEERFAEFSVLWLLIHATRFGADNVAPNECVLEQWRDACRDQGIRARDVLRQGVEQALLTLGNGFLSHHSNTELREVLATNRMSTRDFVQQLLRLVYRQIFLLTIEERGILHREDSDTTARELYAAGYSLRRLRDRAVRRNAHDRHHDLWEGLKLVWNGLATGEARLALPALGGLFARGQCAELDAARLENRHLLLALFHLAWLRDKDQPSAPLTRVNWRDMGSEELGSIYESLLELVPQLGDGNRSFEFLRGAETRGNARKITGSYYTPDSLVQLLLDSALEPVIADKLAASPSGSAAVDALLSITVVDPACGSGHFLLAAARRIAQHLARVLAENAGSGQPTPADYRRALRLVVSRCVFGVDLNPMAVELCNVSLWLEAVEPGLPLTFLSSHIQQGNALLGTTPQLMADGVPDAAWDPIEGDDKRVASALKKRNKKAAGGQRSLDTLWAGASNTEAQAVARAVEELDAASDASPAALLNKESRWRDILDSAEYRHQKFVADAWCAAFVWPKQPGELAEVAPTNELWRQVRDGQGKAPALTTKTVNDLAQQYGFFHWHLQFPQVFAKGGFNVVLGNPPWERVKLQELEFFASRSEEIAKAPNSFARKKLIAALPDVSPQLWADWCIASRTAESESHLARQSGRYPLCGRGDVNTYALFAEHNRSMLGPSARAGFIAPTGLATDETTSAFFDDLMVTRTLASLFDFENREALFPGVHSSYKFALITFRSRADSKMADGAEFVFFARNVGDIADPSRRFVLTSADVKLVNPETRTCPVFRSRRDAELTKALYGSSTVLGSRNSDVSWGVEYLLKMVDPTIHRDMLISRAERQNESTGEFVPLYEGKSIYHFDHRYALFDESEDSRALTIDEKVRADVSIVPRYWLRVSDYQARMQGRPVHYRGFLSVRDITNVTNERTVITTMRPFVPALNSLGNLFCETAVEALFLCGCLNSYAADYIARQKVGGTHLSPFYLLQLAVVSPDVARGRVPWQSERTTEQWVRERAVELTYTAWDLEPFARDVGCDGPPFRWDPERRFLLRCELDAAFFHLYGLSRDDTDYVMDTFPIVRKNDEKAHGEYRTKRVILEIYDAMTEAIRSGKPYQTGLDPPPADVRAAHSDVRPTPVSKALTK